MATEITNLTNAIQELIRKITGTGSTTSSATSTGIVQGVAEAAVTATVINTGSNKMVDAVKTMNDNFKAFVPIKSQAFSSGSTGSRKVDPDGPIGMGVISKPPAPEKDPKEEKEKEKGVGMLTRFNTWITKASVALGAFVAIGMRNTVEGYKLGLAFERLSYQLADAMHYPIVYLTWAINHIAAEFNYLNKIPLARSIMSWAGGLLIGGAALGGLVTLLAPVVAGFGTLAAMLGVSSLALVAFVAGLALLGPPVYNAAYWAGKASHEVLSNYEGLSNAGELFQDTMYDERNDAAKAKGYDNWAEAKKAQEDDKFYNWVNAKPKDEIVNDMVKDRQANPGKTDKEYEDRYFKQARIEFNKDEKEEHNQPMYQTSFMNLTSLWEQMNKAVTENPGLDVVKSWLEDKLGPAIDKYMQGEAPKPATGGGVAP